MRVKNLLSQFPVHVQLSEQQPATQRASPRSDSPLGLQEPSPTKTALRAKEIADALAASSAADQPAESQQNNILDIQPDKATIPPGEFIDVRTSTLDTATVTPAHLCHVTVMLMRPHRSLLRCVIEPGPRPAPRRRTGRWWSATRDRPPCHSTSPSPTPASKVTIIRRFLLHVRPLTAHTAHAAQSTRL